MKDLEQPSPSLAGRILVAVPEMKDFNFRQSVILLSAHDNAKGAMGVIINKPTGQLLGEVRPELADSSLSGVPVYEGGPVNNQELILVAWKWNVELQSFQLFFGLEPERLQELRVEEPELICRAFLGYSGWDEHQLEAELTQNDWLISTYGIYYRDVASENLWKEYIQHLLPDQKHLGNLPEDPSLN